MKLIATAVLALSGLAANAAEPAIYVTMKIEQDGSVIAAPSVLAANAQQTRLGLGNNLQLELRAENLNDSADLRMRVYAKTGEALSLVGAPRVVVAYGQEATVAWAGEAGTTYKVTVKPALGVAQ